MVITPEISTLPVPSDEAPVRPSFKILFEGQSSWLKTHIVSEERSAIHSGKLGDIIYALPACRALGIRHLILNVFVSPNEPLRSFPFRAARELVSLLLAQNYMERVTITECTHPLEEAGPSFPGVDYNFDVFRQVARHRVGRVAHQLSPRFAKFTHDDAPAHLGETFAAALGIRAELAEPWLKVPASSITKNAVVVSITQNWRSYPDWYWHALLKGLPDIIFVGHESEWKRAGIANSRFISADDHLQLASLIEGAALFLGTVSFPYAIAEGLKVPRAVEICHRNLNAFPLGNSGHVLPPDIYKARRLIAELLGDRCPGNYRMVSLPLRVRLFRHLLKLDLALTRANQTKFDSVQKFLRNFFRSILRHLSAR